MTYPLFASAAFAEITGCFAFWSWWRLDKSLLWLASGIAFLVAFAWILGPTTAASIWLVEDIRFDLAGAATCVLGASLTLFAPRGI